MTANKTTEMINFNLLLLMINFSPHLTFVKTASSYGF